jgi:nitrate reductase gamma subunit
MRSEFLFGVWPYVSAVVFLAGLALQFGYAHSRGTAEVGLAGVRALFGGSRLWLLSILLLAVGHLAGLAFPREILLWGSVPLRLYLLEGFAFVAGLGALAGCAGLIWRHLGRPSGPIPSQLADTVLLALLFTAFLSGLLTAAFYRWGSSWGVSTLTPYARSVLSGAPRTALAAQMPFLVQLHIFSSFAAMAAVPFTRLAPLLIAPLRRALALAVRPVSMLAAVVRETFELGLQKYKPAVWIWPEED